MSASLSAIEIKKHIDRMTDRLPREIVVSGKTLRLEVKYFGGYDNFWVLGYGTDDPKDTFIHREEASLEECVLGAWRNLALKKSEWDFVEQPS